MYINIVCNNIMNINRLCGDSHYYILRQFGRHRDRKPEQKYILSPKIYLGKYFKKLVFNFCFRFFIYKIFRSLASQKLDRLTPLLTNVSLFIHTSVVCGSIWRFFTDQKAKQLCNPNLNVCMSILNMTILAFLIH